MANNQGLYPDTFSEDPTVLLPEYLEKLSFLHSADSGYALRYVSDGSEVGPRPFLLVKTFLVIADLGINDPLCLR